MLLLLHVLTATLEYQETAVGSHLARLCMDDAGPAAAASRSDPPVIRPYAPNNTADAAEISSAQACLSQSRFPRPAGQCANTATG